ncbi:MAG: hypothetical protein ABI488_23160 [Polyangiaceae bacterium]
MTAVALYVGACSTYDDSLLEGYDAGVAARGGGGSSGSDAGHAGVNTSAGGPNLGGNSNAEGGMAGVGAGDAGAGADAGAGNDSAVGTGGTSSTGGTGGGTAGSGGSAAGGVTAAGAPAGGAPSDPGYELIDDFEDLDLTLLLSHKRNGPWYLLNDKTAGGVETPNPLVITPLDTANARAGSTAALHITATGFTNWGAGVGANFVSHAPGTKQVPYDVSAYSGIRFYAKVASGSQTAMKVLIPTIYSDIDGGKCTVAAGSKQCGDHLFYQVSGLKTTWQAFQFGFADLGQVPFGLPQPTFDPTSVYSIQFTMVNKTLPVDVWIDDVSFVMK